MTTPAQPAATVNPASAAGLLLTGSNGNDGLVGGALADTLAGGAGDDTLLGGEGADSLDGGVGDDTLRGGDGDDTLDGGWGGIDTASFATAKTDVLVDLSQGLALGEGRDRLVGIERVVGSAHDDRLIGDAGNNRLVGLAGDDALIGGAGNDGLAGNNGDDELTGGAGDDTLWGDGGDDTARFSGQLADYVITADAQGWLVGHAGGGGGDGTDRLRGIESAVFADRVLYLDGANNAPIAVDDTCPIGKQAPVTLIDVLANDYDFEGDALTLIGLDTKGLRGHATITADGRVQYTAGPAFAGLGEGQVATDTLRYTVADGEGALTTATLTLRITGASPIALVSATPDGHADNGDSTTPAVSHDGRFVAFASDAGNLVAGDDPWSRDVFVKDLVTGAIEQVNIDSDGLKIAGAQSLDLSDDGRFVAFSDGWGIFVKDRAGGEARFIPTGPDLDGGGSAPSISGDGRYVVFASSSPDLVAGDTNHGRDIFLADLATGQVSRINTDAEGAQAIAQGQLIHESGHEYTVYDFFWVGPEEWDWDYTATHYSSHSEQVLENFVGGSDDPAISANGRYVVFASDASNLVAGDHNDSVQFIGAEYHSMIDGYAYWQEYRTDFGRDIFRKDLSTGAIERVSTTSSGQEVYNSDSWSPSISADGRYVVFVSTGSLVGDDRNNCSDVFVKDTVSGIVARVSSGDDGQDGNGPSSDPSLSADGRFVTFVSRASNLIADDDNGVADVFVKDLITGALTRVSRDALGRSANGESYEAAIAGDGRSVVFTSYASDIGADHDNSADIFQATNGLASFLLA